MTAHGDDPARHHVTCDDGDLTFVCTAPADAECRTYPTCDCESWGVDDEHQHLGPGDAEPGHESKPGQDCWMKLHIDQDIEACGPVDFEAPRVGRWPVTVEWEGEWCEWEYADPAPYGVARRGDDGTIEARHATPGPNDVELPL